MSVSTHAGIMSAFSWFMPWPKWRSSSEDCHDIVISKLVTLVEDEPAIEVHIAFLRYGAIERPEPRHPDLQQLQITTLLCARDGKPSHEFCVRARCGEGYDSNLPCEGRHGKSHGSLFRDALAACVGALGERNRATVALAIEYAHRWIDQRMLEFPQEGTLDSETDPYSHAEWRRQEQAEGNPSAGLWCTEIVESASETGRGGPGRKRRAASPPRRKGLRPRPGQQAATDGQVGN